MIIGIRPECLHDEDRYLEQFPDAVIEATVDVTELMGAEIYLYLTTGTEEEDNISNLVARVSARSTTKAGDTVKIAMDTGRLHIFDKDTEQCVIH